MQLKAVSALAGVLGLVLTGCGDNQYGQGTYPGYQTSGGGQVVSGGEVVTTGGQQPGGQYVPGGQQPVAGGAQYGAPGGQGPNGQMPGGQGGLVDGPAVSPNAGVLDPNATAIPGGVQQQQPIGQQPIAQQPIAQQPIAQQPIAQRPPQQGMTDYRQPIANGQTMGGGYSVGYQQSADYFRRMQVYDERYQRMYYPLAGQKYVQFTNNLYRRYPNFRLETFHQHYRQCHAQRIYGWRAVEISLQRMNCYDRDLFIDIDIRVN